MFDFEFDSNSNFKKENEFDGDFTSYKRWDSCTINTDPNLCKKDEGTIRDRNPKKRRKNPKKIKPRGRSFPEALQEKVHLQKKNVN